MKNQLCFTFVFLLLISCSSDNVTPSSSEVVETMNLKIGNYWVYEWHEIEPSGKTNLLSRRDSIIIETDSTVNGKTFFVRRSTIFGASQIIKTLLYDSVNSIYSYPDRKMWLTLDKSIVFTEKFGMANNPIAIGYYSIDHNEVEVEVPAGSFEAINFKGRIENQQPGYPYGVRFNDNYYANKVGLIKMRTQIPSSPNDIEMRLVNYGNVRKQ